MVESVEALKFRAFISYSRADTKLAKLLQARLERYVLPQALRLLKPGFRIDRRPLRPIFRDEDELVPGQDLPERIRRGLERSEYLIVVCSRAAVASEWVSKEILDFCALGRGQNILAVVVDGEPNAESRKLDPTLECLPRELRFALDLVADGNGKANAVVTDRPAEPLWVDWRKAGSRNRPMFLRIVASLLELSSLDELVQKDRAYQRKRAALLWSAIGIATCCILVLGVGLLLQARKTAIQSALASSRELAARSIRDQQKDDGLALQEAVEAAQRAETPEALHALNVALAQPREPMILQHESAVKLATYSPDGSLILTVSDDNKARLWSAADAHLVATLSGHTARIRTAVFSPDGSMIVTSSADQTARIWNGRTGQPITTLAGHKGEVYSALFSPDNKLVATGGQDGTARIWSVPEGKQIAALPEKSYSATAVAFSPDGQQTAAGYWDGTITVAATMSGHPLFHASDPDAPPGDTPVYSIHYSSNGAKIIAGVGPRGIVLDARTGRNIFEVDNHAQVGNSVDATFSADDRLIVVADEDDATILFDASNGEPVFHLTGHADRINAARFSPDGMTVVTASDDHTARLWGRDGAALATLHGNGGAVTDASFSPDSRHVATAGEDGTVRVWDLEDPLLLQPLASHPVTMREAEYSADGKRILILADDAVEIHAAADGRLLAKLTGKQGFQFAHFSPDGSRVVTTWDPNRKFVPNEDGIPKLWDASTGKLLHVLSQGSTPVAASFASFSPDGKFLVIVYVDDTVIVWNAETGLRSAVLPGFTGNVITAIFSPDSQRIVTASLDAAAKVWSVDGHLLTTISPGKGKSSYAAFSPDAQQIVTGEDSGTSFQAHLWSAADGRSLLVLPGHADVIRSIDYSADGKRMLTVSSDQAIVWDTVSGAVVTKVVGPAGREERQSAVFSSDGKNILTFGENRYGENYYTVLWDATNGQPIASFPSAQPAAAISPDGKSLVAGSYDGIPGIFTLDFRHLLAIASKQLPMTSH